MTTAGAATATIMLLTPSSASANPMRHLGASHRSHRDHHRDRPMQYRNLGCNGHEPVAPNTDDTNSVVTIDQNYRMATHVIGRPA